MSPDMNHENTSLKAETYLEMAITILAPQDISRARSEIVDGSVRRRVMAEADPHASDDTRALLYRLGRLEEKIEDMLEVLKHRREKPMGSKRVRLSTDHLEVFEGASEPGLIGGVHVFLKMILPSHHHEPILALGQVMPHDEAPTRTIQFLDISDDQQDWIARYVIHRQREQARQKPLQE